jgi:hypothetical protein
MMHPPRKIGQPRVTSKKYRTIYTSFWTQEEAKLSLPKQYFTWALCITSPEFIF